MNSLSFIPEDIASDEELTSWLEEQAARADYHNQLAYAEAGFDEEAMYSDELLTWRWS